MLVVLVVVGAIGLAVFEIIAIAADLLGQQPLFGLQRGKNVVDAALASPIRRMKRRIEHFN